jgi:eukaryotic-like serine/threonine-protein kinase
VIGLIAGRYAVDERLARGGMGDVYRAIDLVLDRPVAVKACRPDGDPRRTALLRREARIAARMGHRAIVPVLDLVRDGDQSFLVMEYVEGPTLRALHALGPVAAPGALRIGLEVAVGLGCIHEQGVLHMDLKLENVLLAPDGQPRITDFGIARCAGEPVVEHQVLGTPRSMSPEQIGGRPVDARSDLFSLGILLYELLTGVTPFGTPCEAQTLARVLEHAPDPVIRIAPRCPAGLSTLIDQLLEKEPALRPQSAAEVVVRLREVER